MGYSLGVHTGSSAILNISILVLKNFEHSEFSTARYTQQDRVIQIILIEDYVGNHIYEYIILDNKLYIVSTNYLVEIKQATLIALIILLVDSFLYLNALN